MTCWSEEKVLSASSAAGGHAPRLRLRMTEAGWGREKMGLIQSLRQVPLCWAFFWTTMGPLSLSLYSRLCMADSDANHHRWLFLACWWQSLPPSPGTGVWALTQWHPWVWGQLSALSNIHGVAQCLQIPPADPPLTPHFIGWFMPACGWADEPHLHPNKKHVNSCFLALCRTQRKSLDRENSRSAGGSHGAMGTTSLLTLADVRECFICACPGHCRQASSPHWEPPEKGAVSLSDR